MSEKHSPGPWRSGRQDMVSYTMAKGEDGGPWKNVYWEHPDPPMHLGEPLPMAVARAYGRTEEEALANARLIAAAPELLAALKHAMGDCERRGDLPFPCETCDAVKALIKRIEEG